MRTIHACGLLLSALLALTACTQTPVKPPVPEAPKPPPAPVKHRPPPLRPMDLPKIITLLENGEFRTARQQLRLAAAANPGDLAAKQLLAQLTTEPTRYLGASHSMHAVEPGESLAGLARKHLGHALEFVSLARYNGIAQPRLLRVGQVLKIPSNYRSPLAALGKIHPLAPMADAPLTNVLDRGWPPPDGLDSVSLGERYRERIAAQIDARQFDDAVATVDAARQRQPAGDAWAPWLNTLDTRANALLWQQRGVLQMALGTAESRKLAYDAFGQALALLPELEPALANRKALRQALVLDYHEAAIVQYRNQQLDQALALWDQALALDPTFAPAQGYRTRALELKRRVQELEIPATPPLPAPEPGQKQ